MRPKILLVDDVRLFLEIEKSFFRHEEVDIFIAEQAGDALVLASVVRPDLIFLDLHMPDMPGDECCRRLKADPVLGQIPVLLVTESDHPEALERCRHSGCDEVVTKPLIRENFLNTARRFLAGRPVPLPRLPARLPIRYWIDAENVLRHYSFNFGAAGIFLETPVILPVDSVVPIEIFLPDSPEPVVCRGRIAWVNAAESKVKDELPSGLGIQFLDLPPSDLPRLHDFLQTGQ